jgi:hypothetical protein
MNRHAILFGVSEYGQESGLKPLNGPENDVGLLCDLYGSSEYGGAAERTHPYKNIPHYEARVLLFRFLKKLDRDDVAVIHFSGHGMQDEDGGLYLCFTDTRADELEISALAVEHLRKMLDLSRARKVLVTLDCCYSGAAGGQLTRDSIGTQLKKIEEKFGEGAGVYVLSASGATETAKETEELGTGVFTHHLARGIMTGDADRDGDGKITVSELAEYLQREVPKDAVRQTPHLWANKVSGTFLVAENRKVAMRREAQRYHETVHRLEGDKVFGSTFASEVKHWIEDGGAGLAEERFWQLLADLTNGSIAGGDFQQEWRDLALAEVERPAPKTDGKLAKQAVDANVIRTATEAQHKKSTDSQTTALEGIEKDPNDNTSKEKQAHGLESAITWKAFSKKMQSREASQTKEAIFFVAVLCAVVVLVLIAG